MNVLQPRIMQGAVGIHPIVVLGSVLIGGRIAGIPGAIFGIPIAAVVSAFVIEFLHRTSGDRPVAGRAAERLEERDGRPVRIPREPVPGSATDIDEPDGGRATDSPSGRGQRDHDRRREGRTTGGRRPGHDPRAGPDRAARPRQGARRAARRRRGARRPAGAAATRAGRSPNGRAGRGSSSPTTTASSRAACSRSSRRSSRSATSRSSRPTRTRARSGTRRRSCARCASASGCSPTARSAYSVDGSPTDAVSLAFLGYFGLGFDLVAAGINYGANLGDDITYSGTVSAAMEAVINNCPAFAISQEYYEHPDFSLAGRAATAVARNILEHGLSRGRADQRQRAGGRRSTSSTGSRSPASASASTRTSSSSGSIRAASPTSGSAVRRRRVWPSRAPTSTRSSTGASRSRRSTST